MALPTLAVLLLVVTSQVLADTCPDRDALVSFDSAAFLGRWYTVKQTAIARNATSIECLSMLVKTARHNPGSLTTHTRFVDHAHASINFMVGVLFKKENSTDGKYLYSRRMVDTDSNKKYYILDTDYRNYAVTWYCFPSSPDGEVSQVYSLLSRQTSLDAELTRAAERRLPEGDYMTVSHEECEVAARTRSSPGSPESAESASESEQD